MPNFNPFSSDAEDTSFEQGLPVNQATKNATIATSTQVQKIIDDTQKDLMNQLYGPSALPEEPGTDEANPQVVDHASTAHAAGQSGKQNNSNSNQTPEEQAKMEKIRHELFGSYASKFKSAPNGAQNIITDMEQEMEKARKEREQKEMQRKQEEEEEEKRKKEVEEEQKQDLVSPAGKKTGFQMGKKQQQPMAVHLAKIKTEGNRGTSG